MNVARKTAIIAAGYLIACTVASVLTVAGMLAPTALPDGGRNGSIYASIGDLAPGAALGLFYTLLCAWPGFIVAIGLGERHGWGRWRDYALAGTANVAPSMLVFAMMFASPFEMPLMMLASIPGGFAGGAAYWFSAGWLIARWRTIAAEAA